MTGVVFCESALGGSDMNGGRSDCDTMKDPYCPRRRLVKGAYFFCFATFLAGGNESDYLTACAGFFADFLPGMPCTVRLAAGMSNGRLCAFREERPQMIAAKTPGGYSGLVSVPRYAGAL